MEEEFRMRAPMWIALGFGVAALPALAQEIVKVPATAQPSVARPDDLFQLPPGQWHFARQLWKGQEPCDSTSCEAGYTSGGLVVSVERSDKFVRIIAGLQGCNPSVSVRSKPAADPTNISRKAVAKLVSHVVKGVGKTCKMTPPAIAALDVAAMFPTPPAK